MTKTFTDIKKTPLQRCHAIRCE